MKQFLGKQVHLPFVGPVTLWLIMFVGGPLVLIVYFSVLTPGPLGTILRTPTLENYLFLLRGAVGRVLLRTLLFASGTNMICLLIGYPLAYWIVKYGGRWKTTLLLLIVIPSWTAYLIRIYSIKSILGYNGFLNQALLSLGLISSPLELLYSVPAVMSGLVYTWLPFMVLPIYAALDGLDPSLLEAAEDLGASPLQRFSTVTLPLTKGGIIAGTILVFIPALGDWIVPLLLGGGKVLMAGSYVQMYFVGAANIPRGSSLATALTAVVLLMLYLGIKFGGEEALERII